MPPGREGRLGQGVPQEERPVGPDGQAGGSAARQGFLGPAQRQALEIVGRQTRPGD